MPKKKTFIPTVPSFAVSILSDLVNYHVDLVLLDRSNREQHWQALKYFWGLHPAQEVWFGKLFCRVRLAELVTTEPTTASQWNELEEDLEEVYNLCRRKDASIVLTTSEDVDAMEDDEEEIQLDMSNKLANLIKLLQVQKGLAPLRAALEEAMDAGTEPKVTKKVLQQVG
jgi:microsomal dipeptidase-like Zn-dependent dipeptidase